MYWLLCTLMNYLVGIQSLEFTTENSRRTSGACGETGGVTFS